MENGEVFGEFMGLFGWNNMLVREGGRLGKESSPGGGGCSRYVLVLFPFRSTAALRHACKPRPLICN